MALKYKGVSMDDLREAYRSTPSSPNWNPAADFDGNGQVWGEDFTMFLSLAREEAPAAPPVETQPQGWFDSLLSKWWVWGIVLGIAIAKGSKKAK